MTRPACLPALLNSLFKVLFIFASRYLFAIGPACLHSCTTPLPAPPACPGSRNLSDDGFLAVTALAGSLTQLALQGGHQVSEDGATALAALTRLRALDLGFSNAMGDDALLPLVARALTQVCGWGGWGGVGGGGGAAGI